MLKTAKRGALQALDGLGILRRAQNTAWRRDRLLILCYHGISIDDEHEWDSRLYMRSDDFENRLRMLRDGAYHVLPLADALDRLYSNRLPPRSVAITFDDGCHDFLGAYELLRKYGVPATVYLTTYYCENNLPVFPGFCAYLLWKGKAAGLVNASRLVRRQATWDLRTQAGRADAMESVKRYARDARLTARQKAELMEDVASALGLDYAAIVAKRIVQIMTPEDVARISGHGVDFELHTHRHRTPDDRALFIREIEENRDRIQSMTGRNAVHFCYPSGVHCIRWLPWLRDAGVASATTGEPGLASERDEDLLLPRLVDSGNLSAIEFQAWLSGVGAWLPRRATGGRLSAVAAS